MQLLQQISDYSAFVPLVAGLIVWPKCDIVLRLILIQIAIDILAEYAGIALIKHYKTNTSFYNLFVLADTVFTCLIGSLLLKKGQRKIVSLAIIFFIIAWITNIWYSGTNKLVNWAFVSGCVCIVVVYLVGLMNIVVNKSKDKKAKAYLWIWLATIVFYGCNVPTFCLINYFIADNIKTADKIYDINLLLITTRSLLMSISFLIVRKDVSKHRVSKYGY